MGRSFLVLAANTFMLLYALDAGISLADELTRRLTGITALASLRGLFAGPVLLLSLVGVIGLAFTPKPPLSVFLPLILSTLWLTLGAPPLVVWVPIDELGLVASGLQIMFAGAAFLRIRQLSEGRSWFFAPEAFDDRPFLSLRHSATYGAGLIGVVLPSLLFAVVVAVASQIHAATAGFVIFDFEGVALADRSYVRDNREIRLVGMMHLGEGEAYRELFNSFKLESTIVLAEGVSDDGRLMEVPISYEGVAQALGLEQQGDIRDYLVPDEEGRPPEWPVIQRADIDLSEFAPETIAALGRIGRVWSASNPLEVLQQIARSTEEDPEMWEHVLDDILHRRNAHVISQIDASLPDYARIVVPWGALHLPAIEAAIRARGFEATSSTQHRLFYWATALAALTGVKDDEQRHEH